MTLMFFFQVALCENVVEHEFNRVPERPTVLSYLRGQRRVPIYHFTWSKENEKSIKQYGLRSQEGFLKGKSLTQERIPVCDLFANEMYRRGASSDEEIEQLRNQCFENLKKMEKVESLFREWDQTFFTLDKEIGDVTCEPHVLMMVDPHDTFVYNSQFKTPLQPGETREQRERLYFESRMSLADYIKLKEVAECMRERFPGHKVYHDPLTGEPKYVLEEENEKKYRMGTPNLYISEIPYRTHCISPDRLEFELKQQGDDLQQEFDSSRMHEFYDF